MKTFFSIATLLILLVACNNKAAKSGDAQASPKAVAEAIFDAAKNGKTGDLAALIDSEADSDSKMIAQAATDKSIEESFIKHFSKGKVAGEVTIDGDKASVPILFGPDGTKEETFQMVQKSGKWYLVSF